MKIEFDAKSEEDNRKVGIIIFNHKKNGLRFKIPMRALSHQGKNKNQQKHKLLIQELKKQSEDNLAQAYMKRFRNKPLSLTIYFFLTKELLNSRDIDNLCKTILDGLKGSLFEDDVQIMHLDAYKEHVNKPEWEWIGIQINRWHPINYKKISSQISPSKRKQRKHEPKWLQEYNKGPP